MLAMAIKEKKKLYSSCANKRVLYQLLNAFGGTKAFLQKG
jgi:hypothetical protein